MVSLAHPSLLPPGQEWPPFMVVSDAPIKVSLRETYAKIAWQVHRNRTDDAEAQKALAWCRRNGNPHKEQPDGA